MTTPAERTRAVLDMERYVRDLWLYQDGKSSRALVPRHADGIRPSLHY